jgi:hypothetical protein
LVDLITDAFDLYDLETAPLDEKDKPDFIALRDRLRELADMLDKVITPTAR